MSRRFGRNQRRRAREELAAAEFDKNRLRSQVHNLTGTAQVLTHALSQIEKKCQAFEAAVEGMFQALGENSVMLAPLKLRIASHYLPRFQIPEEDRSPYMFNTDVDETATITANMFSVIEAAIETNHWARKKHFMIKFEDRKHSVYAIDETVLSDRRAHQVIERQLVPVLVAAFMGQMAERSRG